MLDEKEEQYDLADIYLLGKFAQKEPNLALVVVKQEFVVYGNMFCLTHNRYISWVVRVISTLNGLGRI